MDAYEVARHTAAALHEKAVQAGVDPYNSYALAKWAAEEISLDVDVVAPKAAALNGGQALFDPSGRLILHEQTSSPFLNAFLVGHELGHATLGDDQDPVVVPKINPATSAESAPVGEDRVVDYSRRQRREVQMDLFGRELLMPRPWLRELHLGGMSASEIAEKLGAPFDAVAQQLLDALLLPPVTLEDAAEKPEKPLNPEQKDAAEHRGVPYLLEAGPGTGKTQTLVGRVRYLVEERKVDPREILVLTFSNKAAAELSDRIAARQPQAAAAMWIGTFHAFGLDLVQRFHKELKFAKEPRMMDRPEAIDLLEAEFTRLDISHYRNLWDPSEVLRDLLNAISRAKDEVVGPAEYASLAEAMRKRAASIAGNGEATKALEAGAAAAEVAKVYEAYERLKHAAGAVDFGDLMSMPARLLQDNSGVSEQLRERYKHVLVDEYQDVNRASVKLLQSLTGGGENLWAVGDARQSIYRFRGASSFNMVRFTKEDFPGGISGRLVANYRSTEEIVSAYSNFARDMAAGVGPADLHAKRGPSKERPQHLQFPTNDFEGAALADAIQAQHAQGRAWRDQAVLCKGNDRLARLGAELERRGVPVLFLGSLFERPEIKDLLSVLSLLVDRRAMALARRTSLTTSPMALGDVASVLSNLRSSEVKPLAWLEADFAKGVGQEGAIALTEMAELLAGFSSDDQPWDVLSKILLDRTRLAAEIAAADDISSRSRGLAVWQFLNFVRADKPQQGRPITRLLDRIRRLVLLADERDLRQLPLAAQSIDAVRLMTIHGSKGLEFDVVHLLGLNAQAFPWRGPGPKCPPPDDMIEGAKGTSQEATAASEAEEQECLFYVALSRARDGLLLYSAQSTTNGRPRKPSPYLERLGQLDTRAVTPVLGSDLDDDAVPIPVKFPAGMRFTENQLELYDRCPRRFFYTHILEVGGRRTGSAFTDMHDLVQSVVRSLSQRPPEEADDAVVADVFASAFDEHEIASHGYAPDFRRIAGELINFFAESRRGKSLREVTPIRLAVPGGEIVITPDEVLHDGQGHLFRRVRSGHKSSKAEDGLAAAAFYLAAVDAFPGARVELVYLADAASTPVSFKAQALENRRGKVNEALSNIAAGRFSTEVSAFTCPRCPAFFICGPVGEGFVEKIF